MLELVTFSAFAVANMYKMLKLVGYKWTKHFTWKFSPDKKLKCLFICVGLFEKRICNLLYAIHISFIKQCTFNLHPQL